MKIIAVLPGFPPFADAPDVEAAMLVQYERPPAVGSPDPTPVTGTMRVAECRGGIWTGSADPDIIAQALVFVQAAFTREAFKPRGLLDVPDNLAERIAKYEATERARKLREVELELSALRNHEATTIVWVVRDGQDYYAGGGVGVTDPARARRYASERAALADSGWQAQISTTARVEAIEVPVPPNWTHCAACNGRGIAPKGAGSMAIGGGPDFLCGVCRGMGQCPPPIAGVLLLPTAETREALLAPGVPLAARLGESVWILWKADPAVVGDTAPLALVLAWAGVEHADGCRRAFDVAYALHAQWRGLGEVVYVDKHGNEVPNEAPG